MKHTTNCIILLLLTAAQLGYAQRPVPAKAQEQSILLTGATIHVGNGKIIENGAIGFDKGLITIVSTADKVDKSTYSVVDVSGQHIYPGIIAPNVSLGLAEVGAVRATRDFAEVGAFNPHVRALIAYNTDSKITPTVRTNGILMVQTTPRSGIISGSSSVMELDGWNWEDAVSRADDGIHLNWPSMFVNRGWWAEPEPTEKNKQYNDRVNELYKFLSDAKAYNKMEAKEKNLRFASMKGVFDGTQNLYVHANFVKEITAAVTTLKSLGISKIVLVGGKDSWMITDFLKENNISVILAGVHELPQRNSDDIDLPYKTPKLLQDAGILYCLSNQGGMEQMNTRNLPFYAGTTVGYGLSKEEALSAVTLNAAKILGIEKTHGSLEVGKHATLFISTGDALDMRTNIVSNAYIFGRLLDLNNEQLLLYNTYLEKYGLGELD